MNLHNLLGLNKDEDNPSNNSNAKLSNKSVTIMNDKSKDEAKTGTLHKSLYYDLKEFEIRDMCRHQIDALEHWSRRLLDETFRREYGEHYLQVEVSVGQPLVKKEVLDRIQGRVRSDPSRFPRDIDAIVIEDLIYFFCRDDLYKKHFKDIFEVFFSCVAEVRSVLQRISSIRNKLSHGNIISLHEAEQCICYSNDFIDVFKKYYQKIGKEKDYNVPVFISAHDNLGHIYMRKDSSYGWEFWPGHAHVELPDSEEFQLRSGDEYKLWIEVDNSYDKSTYSIEWRILNHYKIINSGEGNEIEFKATDELVSCMVEIDIYLKTNKNWHRFAYINCDDHISMKLSPILPPIDETY